MVTVTRVVLDTNVLVAAVYNPASASRRPSRMDSGIVSRTSSSSEARPRRPSILLAPPNRPTLISVSPKVAFSPATIMSATPTIPSPPPTTTPSTAATTGTRQWRMAHCTRRHGKNGSSCVRSSSSSMASERRSLRSRPAQK